MSPSPSAPMPVLLFDGECGLCHRIVRRLLRSDRRGRLRFAPLQGVGAQAYLKEHGLPTADFDTLVFVTDWNQPRAHPPLFRTDGMLAAAAVVGGGWRLVSWLRVLPAGLRDPFYKLVARTRYALFGPHRPSPLPDPAWIGRFLE